MKESMNIRWVAETGIVEAIEPIITEYKETRGLLVSLVCSSTCIWKKLAFEELPLDLILRLIAKCSLYATLYYD